MANSPSKPMKTYYEKEDTGQIVFKERQDFIKEITNNLELVENVSKNPDLPQIVKERMAEIKLNLESLKYSELPPAELQKKIKTYTQIPVAKGKWMHLSAFLTSTGNTKVVSSEQQYIQQVQKMIKNTMANLTNLLINHSEDEHLSAFFDELKSLKPETDYQTVKTKMDHLTMSGIIKHYNIIKLNFLQDWLKPYEEYLGKSIQEMSENEVQQALTQVEGLKKKQLEKIGLHITTEKLNQFYPFNKKMHELMNGKSTHFWGYPAIRDEFITLIQQAINRFSFKMENQFLIFETADKSMVYLLGFPEESFEKSKKMKSDQTKVGLIPHLKVLFKVEDGYKELEREHVSSLTEYYRMLKTAVVPFLGTLSATLEIPLSDQLKDAFDMWI